MSTPSTRCAQCGFDLADVTPANAADEVRVRAESLATAIARADPGAHRRPEPDRWSAVEYAGHVRDVLLVQRDRVLMTRMFDVPHATPMGRDERAAWGEYEGLDVTDLAGQIRDAAGWLARTFARLAPSDWERRLVYTYPEPAERSLVWLAANTVHELVHHEMDIRTNLERD